MRPATFRLLLIGFAALVVVVVVFAILANRRRPAMSEPAATPAPLRAVAVANEPETTPTAPPPVATPEAAATTGEITLQVRLASFEGVEPDAISAAMAPRRLEQTELLAFMADGAAGIHGSGPMQIEEIGNTAVWKRAQVKAGSEPGVLAIEMAALPLASAYEVLAWDPDYAYWYLRWQAPGGGKPGATYDLGLLAPTRATRLEVRFENNTPGDGAYLVRLERTVSEDPDRAERASARLPLVEWMNPPVAFAYADRTPLLLDAALSHDLAPLLPDERLQLLVSRSNGDTAPPVEVALVEGGIAQVVLDLSLLFANAAQQSTRLQGQLVIAGTGRGLAEATIQRAGGVHTEIFTTDANGHFEIPEVPWGPPVEFHIEPSYWAGEDRPPFRDYASIVFEAPRDATGALPPPPAAHKVLWNMPGYNWLLLELSEPEREALAQELQPPYPIFTLERRDDAGVFAPAPSERLVQEAEGVSMSIKQPGDYRIQAAIGPLSFVPSEVASFSDASTEFGGEQRTRMIPPGLLDNGPERAVRLINQQTGQPMASVRVVIQSPGGFLPPVRSQTDAEGRLLLGHANTPRITISVERQVLDEVEVTFDLPTGRDEPEVLVP